MVVARERTERRTQFGDREVGSDVGSEVNEVAKGTLLGRGKTAKQPRRGRKRKCGHTRDRERLATRRAEVEKTEHMRRRDTGPHALG